MQPFSSTHVPMSDVTSNPSFNEPAKTNPSGTLGKFAVAVQSGITTFFSSLSPNYVPEHQRQTNQPTAPVVNMLPAENKNDKTSLVADVVQGVGLASKVLSCWVPNVSEVSDAVGTLCSSFSLAHSLDNMAKSGKEPTSGSENVPKPHSQEITNKHQEDEKQGKPVTASNTTNSVSGPAIATVTLMAMDRLASAAALPEEGKPGSRNNPICVNGSEICVNGSEILGKIGQEGYPPNGSYRQTKSFSHNSGVAIGSVSTPFTGRYDGGGHTIRDPQRCLFSKLGRGAIVHDLNVANGVIENSDRYSAALACEMGEQSTVRNILVEDTSIINKRASNRTSTGVITGLQQTDSLIECAVVKNCSVTTSERYSVAGIGAGKMSGEIEHLAVTDSWVLTMGGLAHAGIGGGQVCGDIRNITVVKSRVTTDGKHANVAIGGGMVGGFGTHCEPGLDGSVNDLVALDSYVRTEGSRAYAGIGGGMVAGEVRGGIAINCNVTTANNRRAGIDSGYSHGNKTTEIRTLNSWVNGDLQNSDSVYSPELCRTVDSRLVNDDCQLTDSLTEDHWYRNCSTSTASSTASSTDSAPARSTATRQHSRFLQPASATTNKTVMADTTSQQPAMTQLNEKVTADTTSSQSRPTLTSQATLGQRAMTNTTSPLPGPTLTSQAPVDQTAMASPLSGPTLTSQPPVDKTAMASPTSPLSSPTLTSQATLGQRAMANTTSPLSSPTLTTPAPLNEMVMSNTAITGHTMTTPLPTINATVTSTAPLAMAAMTTTAPVTENGVTLPEASVTFAGMPPTTVLPTTPPLVTIPNTGLILGVSLGTAFTILAGIGLYAFYQYHRRGEAPKQAEPEIPLEPLNQQANN
ncbi:hypothetical protein [Endozoicomonas sp. ALE010]|uniref:hypothetical protein n=1 Tax=Endozoicomonas sp. ALE010 TaxID=3403081 RepID=UPI003BB76D61